MAPDFPQAGANCRELCLPNAFPILGLEPSAAVSGAEGLRGFSPKCRKVSLGPGTAMAGAGSTARGLMKRVLCECWCCDRPISGVKWQR